MHALAHQGDQQQDGWGKARGFGVHTACSPNRLPAPGTGARFADRERQHLLLSRGIGPRMVESLEAAGICSIEVLRSMGAHRVFAMLGAMGHPARHWGNRARALERAIGEARIGPTADRSR